MHWQDQKASVSQTYIEVLSTQTHNWRANHIIYIADNWLPRTPKLRHGTQFPEAPRNHSKPAWGKKHCNIVTESWEALERDSWKWWGWWGGERKWVGTKHGVSPWLHITNSKSNAQQFPQLPHQASPTTASVDPTRDSLRTSEHTELLRKQGILYPKRLPAGKIANIIRTIAINVVAGLNSMVKKHIFNQMVKPSVYIHKQIHSDHLHLQSDL